MNISFRRTVPVFVFALLFGLSACGSEDEAATSTVAGESAETQSSADNDDEDHKEGKKDEHDEDHDEDHDDEHDDEEHDDDAKSGLGAHEHGVAELSVAWDEGDMVIDLVSPAINIYGFENEPTTDEEKAVVEESDEILSDADVVAINAEAGCELSEDAVAELEIEGSHAEVTTSWLLTCENPEEINELDASALFSEFPGLEDVDAQWASATGQSSAELSASSATLALE